MIELRAPDGQELYAVTWRKRVQLPLVGTAGNYGVHCDIPKSRMVVAQHVPDEVCGATFTAANGETYPLAGFFVAPGSGDNDRPDEIFAVYNAYVLAAYAEGNDPKYHGCDNPIDQLEGLDDDDIDDDPPPRLPDFD